MSGYLERLTNFDYDNHWLRQAIAQIKAEDGVDVSASKRVSTYGGPKAVYRPGVNSLVGTTPAALQQLPAGILIPTYPTSNSITSLSSSNAGDTGSILVCGFTLSAGAFTYVEQTATLNGQNIVALATPLARVCRLRNLSASDWLGTVYAFETGTVTAGVPDTAAGVHLIGEPGENLSHNATATTSSTDYLILTSFGGTILKKQAAYGVLRLRVRRPNGVFMTEGRTGLTNGAELPIQLAPYIIVPPNSDVIMTAEADAASTAIGGSFSGILAGVQ